MAHLVLALLLSRSGHLHQRAFFRQSGEGALAFFMFTSMGRKAHTWRLGVLVSQACHGETRRDKTDPKLNSLGWVGAGEGGGEGGGVELGGLFCPFSFPNDKPVPEPPISMCVQRIENILFPVFPLFFYVFGCKLQQKVPV